MYNLNNDDLEIIIKNIIETKKAEETYGYITDEYEFPYPIEKKLELLNPSEYEDVIKGAQERFPDKKYLIWSRVGRNTINKTVGGDYVTSSQGYTILSDIESGEMIYYDYTSQSVAWGPDLDEVSRELFTSYGKLIASQITRYL